MWNTTLRVRDSAILPGRQLHVHGLDVRNVLFLGSSSTMPGGLGNVQATAAFFVNAAAHDYRLAPGSLAINAGVSISSVSQDRIGVRRPQGAYWDVGAYEFVQ